jgi:molecular chaperone DnaK
MESQDADAMRKAAEELSQSSHKLAEAMYAKASQQQQAAEKKEGAGDGESGGRAEGGKKKDDVVDADFTEVKE